MFYRFFYEIATYKKSKEIKIRSLWISSGISIALLLIFRFLANIVLGGRFWWLNYIIIPLIGAGVGLFLGRTRRLEKRGGKIYSQGTIWYLLVWAISMILLQLVYLVNLLGILNFVVYAALFGTAVLVVTNLVLILKINKLKKPVAPAPSQNQYPGNKVKS